MLLAVRWAVYVKKRLLRACPFLSEVDIVTSSSKCSSIKKHVVEKLTATLQTALGTPCFTRETRSVRWVSAARRIHSGANQCSVEFDLGTPGCDSSTFKFLVAATTRNQGLERASSTRFAEWTWFEVRPTHHTFNPTLGCTTSGTTKPNTLPPTISPTPAPLVETSRLPVEADPSLDVAEIFDLSQGN